MKSKKETENTQHVATKMTKFIHKNFKKFSPPAIFLGISMSMIEHFLSDIDDIDGLSTHKKNEAREVIIKKMDGLYLLAKEAYIKSRIESFENDPNAFEMVLENVKEEKKEGNFVDYEENKLIKTKH